MNQLGAIPELEPIESVLSVDKFFNQGAKVMILVVISFADRKTVV